MNTVFGYVKNREEGLASSPTNYWFGFVVDITMIAVFLISGAFSLGSQTDLLLAVAVSASGVLFYTLYEYAFHRWFFHVSWSPGRDGHLIHHRDEQLLAGLPFFGAAMVYCSLWLGIYAVFGSLAANFFVGAGLVGYTVYGVLHHLQHHARFRNGLYTSLRKHHMVHHSFPDVNFGVTTTLWDWVFRTHFKQHETRLVAERRVSAR